MKHLLTALTLLLIPVAASAQQAYVVDLGAGNYVGVLITPDGVYPISKLTIITPSELPSPTTDPKRVTYVYEKDEGGVPPGVAAALIKINRDSPAIIASEFENDTVDGTGQVPEQYAKALAEARKAGLPALVVEDSNGNVLQVLKAPKTQEEVLAVLKKKGVTP